MAMMTCPECGKEISDTAESCPNCGYRIKKKKKNGCLIVLIVIIVVFLLFVFAIWAATSETDNSTQKSQIVVQSETTESSLLSDEDTFNETCAKYIFDFIKNGSFYNPSAVRVLRAAYAPAEKEEYAQELGADGILYVTVQGTNRMGGTLRKDYVVVMGGTSDGEAFRNEDDDGKGLNDYSLAETEIDAATINEMLQDYWEELGIS